MVKAGIVFVVHVPFGMPTNMTLDLRAMNWPSSNLQPEAATPKARLPQPDSPIWVLLAVGVAIILKKCNAFPEWFLLVHARIGIVILSFGIIVVFGDANAGYYSLEQLDPVFSRLVSHR